MDSKIEEAINFVHSYAPSIKEWKVLKKELLKCLHPNQRKLFSTRDPSTKKIIINQFELSLIDKWKTITGVDLYLGKT